MAGVVYVIPVSANGAGVAVRVEIALGDSEPAETSRAWHTVGTVDNDDLPGSVQTYPIPHGTTFWHRAAAVDSDGYRVSEWTSAVSVEVDLLPGFDALDLDGGGAGPYTLEWTANAETGGVLVEWDVHDLGDSPTYASSEELDSSDGEFEIPDLLPVEDELSVRVTPYAEFAGGEVDGDAGDATTLTVPRPGDATTEADTLAGLSCRIYVTNDLDLYHWTDGCLVVSRP